MPQHYGYTQLESCYKLRKSVIHCIAIATVCKTFNANCAVFTTDCKAFATTCILLANTKNKFHAIFG